MKKQLLVVLVILTTLFSKGEAFSGMVVEQNYMLNKSDNIASTFMLSNEAPGYLINNLIAQGHGGKNLCEVLQLLQPKSGCAIPQWFMDKLAACPAGSDIFTVALSYFSDASNNPTGTSSDGSWMAAPVFGKDFFSKGRLHHLLRHVGFNAIGAIHICH